MLAAVAHKHWADVLWEQDPPSRWSQTESEWRLFTSGPKKWRITSRRHLVQIMEKLIIAYGSCQIISAFYILRPPEVPSVPFHASSWVAKQAADAQSAAAATHKSVYLAGERRQRLCRPISTVTPTTMWNCECNSLNTVMEGVKGG